MKKANVKKHKEFDHLIDELDFTPILDQYVRQVRWLYHNSNKCTMVYEEKLVRLIIYRLKTRIKQLENETRRY